MLDRNIGISGAGSHGAGSVAMTPQYRPGAAGFQSGGADAGFSRPAVGVATMWATGQLGTVGDVVQTTRLEPGVYRSVAKAEVPLYNNRMTIYGYDHPTRAFTLEVRADGKLAITVQGEATVELTRLNRYEFQANVGGAQTQINLRDIGSRRVGGCSLTICSGHGPVFFGSIGPGDRVSG